MAAPLTGIKVIDLTRVLAGPYAGMLLYDLGSDVLKVENPAGGDDARAFGPFKGEESLYFTSFNRGRKSLSLNLKTEEGKKILQKLVKEADILLENFRPGTMEKLGLGYEELKRINPKLIYGAVSGFGHTGPDSKLPAYDILAQARGGIMSITGHKGSAPTRVGTSIGDITAGLFAVIGIVSALYQRQATGRGQKVDISMLDCQVALLENALVRYQSANSSPEPLGHRHPSLTPFQAFRAQDKYFVIAAGNDSLWGKLCTALQCEDKIKDPRFLTNDLRHQNVDALDAELSAILGTKTADEWLKIIGEAGIPCCHINGIKDLFTDKQLQARNMFIPCAGVKLAGNPIKMETLPERAEYPPSPSVGENNFEILACLGYNDDEIANLKEKGII